jgi:ribosome-interacting GTPase 1
MTEFSHTVTLSELMSHIVLQVPQSELDLDTVKSILSEYRIHNADITLRYDATSDDLIDVIEGNRIYVPCIYLLNKIGMYNNR